MSDSAFGQAAAKPTGGESTPLTTTVTNATTGAAPTSQNDTGGSLVRTIVGLAIVVAVIYGVTWVLKQTKGKEGDEVIGDGLESTASLPLGSGRMVHLVRAGNEYLLLGVTDGGVQPLRSYTEMEAIAAGFPVGQVDDAPPLKERGEPGTSTTLIERFRDLTVRR